MPKTPEVRFTRQTPALVFNDRTGKAVAAFDGADGPYRAQEWAHERFSEYTVVQSETEFRAHKLWLRDRDRPTTWAYRP